MLTNFVGNHLVQYFGELLPDVRHHLQHVPLGPVVKVPPDVLLSHRRGEGARGGASALLPAGGGATAAGAASAKGFS